VIEQSLPQTFSRSALTSLFTTALDFGVLTGLVELAHVDYVLATFIGSAIGATANFLINRAWAFAATDGHLGHQAFRHALVQAGAAGLHTTGVWAFTRGLGAPYLIAKALVAVLTYVAWNYPLNHLFVFRRR
jgi:putative flippase GtrA